MNKKPIVFLSLAAALLTLCLSACGAAEAPADAAEAAQPSQAVEAEPTAQAPAAQAGSGSLQQGGVPEDARSARIGETGGADMEKALRLYIDGTQVAVDWEENESVEALIALASAEPLRVQMSMYGGFEQVGSLGTSLPRSDAQTVTQAGDIVLYSGNQLVVFYGSNSWSYTRLGRIANVSAEDLSALLANGDVVLTLSFEQEEEK